MGHLVASFSYESKARVQFVYHKRSGGSCDEATQRQNLFVDFQIV